MRKGARTTSRSITTIITSVCATALLATASVQAQTPPSQAIESVAVFVRKSDAPPAAGETMKVALAPKGEKPAGWWSRRSR